MKEYILQLQAFKQREFVVCLKLFEDGHLSKAVSKWAPETVLKAAPLLLQLHGVLWGFSDTCACFRYQIHLVFPSASLAWCFNYSLGGRHKNIGVLNVVTELWYELCKIYSPFKIHGWKLSRNSTADLISCIYLFIHLWAGKRGDC